MISEQKRLSVNTLVDLLIIYLNFNCYITMINLQYKYIALLKVDDYSLKSIDFSPWPKSTLTPWPKSTSTLGLKAL